MHSFIGVYECEFFFFIPKIPEERHKEGPLTIK